MVYNKSTDKASRSSKRPVNTFANDGSFLEMFKKMQEQGSGETSTVKQDGNKSSEDLHLESKESAATSQQAVVPPADVISSKPGVSNKPGFVGKRRGGRFLATGKVKKLKLEQEEEEEPPKDAWSLYLAEVKKYKQTTCEEEGKTRPLVK